MRYKCPECGNDVEVMCYDCGYFLDRPTFLTPPAYESACAVSKGYDKIIHFREVLDRFQGRERTDIPETIITAVKGTLPDDIGSISLAGVKKALTRLKLTKYLPHAPLILYLIHGTELPYIPRESCALSKPLAPLMN